MFKDLMYNVGVEVSRRSCSTAFKYDRRLLAPLAPGKRQHLAPQVLAAAARPRLQLVAPLNN